MKIYRKNVNKTAESIVNKICNNGDVIIVEISKAAYDWLYMNAGSLANLVEKLLSDRLGGEYYVVINREKDYDYSMHVEWYKVNN